MRKINATCGRSFLQPDSNFYPGGAVRWMRYSIKLPKGRRLRVVIYTRISTDDQKQQSLEAQAAFCRQALPDIGLHESQFEVCIIEDDGISGEYTSRPGIDEVMLQIRKRRIDLLIVEDASRLYRIENACFQLVEVALEHASRVLCVRDRVDSAEDGIWGVRLHEAMQQHGKANEFTRYRIERTREDLWLCGAAVAKRKPGYLRTPSIPATVHEPASGPWFDEVDPDSSAIIIEAFQIVAAEATAAELARFLKSSGVVRQGKQERTDWTWKNVLPMIRDPLYRGHEEFRRTHSRRPWMGGKATVQKSDPDEVWHRDMQHLRIVSDHLWYSANDAIDKRRSTTNRRHGSEHPLFRIPRDSRSSVAGLLNDRA